MRLFVDACYKLGKQYKYANSDFLTFRKFK